jgi:hypothetical protein
VILCDGSTIKADHILTCRVAEPTIRCARAPPRFRAHDDRLPGALRNDRTVRYSPFSWSHFEEVTPHLQSRIVD